MTNQIIESEIDNAVDLLLKNQVAATVSREMTKLVMTKLAYRVEQQASREVLMSLLSLHDVAQHFGVSDARIRAKAIALRKRGFSPGWQVQGMRAWLFRPEELENLKPAARGRPKGGETAHPDDDARIFQRPSIGMDTARAFGLVEDEE